jgi:hypothetical protein
LFFEHSLRIWEARFHVPGLRNLGTTPQLTNQGDSGGPASKVDHEPSRKKDKLGESSNVTRVRRLGLPHPVYSETWTKAALAAARSNENGSIHRIAGKEARAGVEAAFKKSLERKQFFT